MKYLIYLSFLFFISEFLLMLIKRSNKNTSKQRSDKGSLILLWVMITLNFTFGFIFANYRIWEFKNYIFGGVGLLIILAGFTIRWMAIIQLKKAFTVDVAIGAEQKLKMDGIFKYIRHPSYLGLLLIMTGFAICMNSLISILIIVIPMFLTIQYRIWVEEKVLLEEFGDRYNAYKAKTKKMIPWFF